MAKLRRLRTDPMQRRREQARDYLLRITPVIDSHTAYAVDTAYADMLFAVWRGVGFPPLRWGDARLSALLRQGSDAFGAAVEAEADVLRLVGRDIWAATVAQRHGLSRTRLEDGFRLHLDRWGRPGLQLPDDWLIVERMALALVADTAPMWILDGIRAA